MWKFATEFLDSSATRCVALRASVRSRWIQRTGLARRGAQEASVGPVGFFGSANEGDSGCLDAEEKWTVSSCMSLSEPDCAKSNVSIVTYQLSVVLIFDLFSFTAGLLSCMWPLLRCM